MKSKAGIIFAKLRDGFNCNIRQLLNKECSQPLCNVTNIQKRYAGKLSKPNLFSSIEKRDSRASNEKIGVYGYFLLGIPIGTFILGTWQVQRRKWKLNLLETLNTYATLEPVELPENLDDLKSKEYCPVKVKGTFLHEREFLVGPRSLIVNGEAADANPAMIGHIETKKGFCVITPFKLVDRDLTILVNRGWVPKVFKNPAKRPGNQIEGEVEITGIVRLHENRPPFLPKNSANENVWYYRDLNAMSKMAGTAPVYIDMVYNKSYPEYPRGGQTQIKLRNEHLSYIITWYSLSGFTLYMWIKHFVQKIPIVA